MDTSKINDDFFRYIADNAGADPLELRLKAHGAAKTSFDLGLAITQVECRRKARRKLPELSSKPRFIYPSPLSVEQSTGEAVAKLHASIVGQVGSVLDMTAGLGVDSYYIAGRAERVTAVEIDPEKAAAARWNMDLYRPNVSVICGDSAQYLTANPDLRFDAVFIDPSRRAGDGSRVFGFSQCEPNVLPLLPIIGRRAGCLHVKASPMLDITQSLRELRQVTHVWVISLGGECRELFFKVDFTAGSAEAAIHCLDITAGGEVQELTCTRHDIGKASTAIAPGLMEYLYEPNASIMKAGVHHAATSRWGLAQLSANSHLYTGSELVNGFHGRSFRVIKSLPFNVKALKRELKGLSQANVTTRNFPLTALQLRKRLNLADGGDSYIFATTLASRARVVALCQKV